MSRGGSGWGGVDGRQEERRAVVVQLERQGLSKPKRKVDIAKKNMSILLHCENSACF